MPTHEIIQQRLAAALRANRPLELLSGFKGVPVRFKAALLEIQAEGIIIQTSQPEAVCLDLDREVVVLGEGGDEALRADVVEVQMATGRARLARLRHAGDRLGNRLTVRVEPQTPIQVRLTLGGQTVVAQMVDLSMGGMAAQVAEVPPGVALKAHVMAPVAFDLPSGLVEMVGLIRSVRPEGTGKRLGISFPQDANVSVIVGYVLQRRVEILAELQQKYAARV